MRVDDAYKGFRALLKDKGRTLGGLTPIDGVRLSAEFFRQTRMEDVESKDGDGLIFYYAIVNRGRGSPFEVGMIRTFRIKGSNGADGRRLRLTFNYSWTEVLIDRKLQARLAPDVPEGNRFCWSLEQLPSFESFVLGHPVIETVSQTNPRSVNLKLEPIWGAFG